MGLEVKTRTDSLAGIKQTKSRGIRSSNYSEEADRGKVDYCTRKEVAPLGLCYMIAEESEGRK